MLFRNLLVAFGVIFILGGIFMALNLMQTETPSDIETARSSAAQAPDATEYEILTTAYPLTAGTLLREADIVWKQARREEIRPGVILRGETGSDQVMGAITRRDFAEGEALLAAGPAISGRRSAPRQSRGIDLR
jgi:Flp pilus assembly protein CpaB